MIKPFETDNLYSINAIIQKLHPGWFDENAVRNIPVDIQFDSTLIALEDDNVVGFIVSSCKDSVLRIEWLAVDPISQGKGIGKLLVENLIDKARGLGIKKVQLETVVFQEPADGTYDKTIGFYKHLGFKVETKEKKQKYKNINYRIGIFSKDI